MADNYTFKYTNGYANYKKIDDAELKIEGDCKITNYDTRVDDGKDKGEITIDFTAGEQSVKAGTGTGYKNTPKADFSNKKFSIFKEIAALDGDSKELSIEDIKKMNKSLIQKWGLKDLRFDFKNGVATLVWGENDILRIDFTMKHEVSAKNTSSTTASKEKATTKNVDVKVENKQKKDTKAFLEALGGQETKGKSNPYFCMNKYGYVGKYQMGEQAMADMGIYHKKADSKTGKVNYNNDWSGIFKKNKYGINCLWDYRKSPEKQEQLQIDYKKRDWQYVKNKGLLQFIGKTINGVKITESGMLAGAHLVGAGGLSRYLKSNGADDVTDKSGTPVSKYIKQFAGYDVSAITS